MKTPSRLIANVKPLHFKQGSIIAIKKKCPKVHSVYNFDLNTTTL